jgi:hypothetical protein
MKQYTCFSPRASLAILGQQTQKREIWKTIGEHVQNEPGSHSPTCLRRIVCNQPIRSCLPPSNDG